MPNNAIDLTILISLDCCFDALLPNFPEKERAEKISMARHYLSSSRSSLEEIVKNQRQNRLLEKKLRDSICDHFDHVARKTIERYLRRLERGFITSVKQDDLSEKILNAGRCIEILSDDFIYEKHVISLIAEIAEKTKFNY